MARLKIKLIRNLRRDILRGHPWIYREAIAPPPAVDRAQLAQVSDAKGELGWAIYDPHGPLALRMVSPAGAPPTANLWAERFARAWAARASVRSTRTECYRLFNGEGDLLPGLVCDVYGPIAVVQFDGRGPAEFWDRGVIADWLLTHARCTSVIEKTRRSGGERGVIPLAGETAPLEIEVRENDARFLVNLEKGQKTGFFLDQRENRLYARQVCAGQSVLNLFSYTGGFSINAGLGGATRVASLDVSRGAIEMAEASWALNGLPPSQHEGLCVDVFAYLNGAGETWDHIIVDPPSMSHAEDQRDLARAKYVEVFGAAAKRVRAGGHLSLSSCSSHVTFDDFFEIITQCLSAMRRRGQILRVSGQGPDHPFPHAAPELRYLKFVHLILD